MKKLFTYRSGRKNWTIWFVSLLVSCIMQITSSKAQTFVHPGIPFTKADLDQLKANISKEPWLTGYNALKSDSHSQLTYSIHGPYATVTRAPNLNNSGWRDDMNAIHNLAFMYVFTGDSAYARKATNMLDAWAVTNTVWGGGENMLDIGDMAPFFIAGADILRSTFPGWTAANDAHVNNYFRNVLYPTSWVPNPLRDCNKGALQLQIAIGISAYLGDATLWNQAIEVYRMDAGGGLRASLPNGEVGDSGRDDHWWVEVQALGWSAEVAWKQGVDLFSEFNNRLLAIGELYSQYSQAPGTVNFIPFGGYSNYWTNWGIPPGVIHQSPFNNIIKGAYALRKGIPTPYTEQIRALAGEGSWSFLYLKSSDTSHATPLTPVVYPGTLALPVTGNLSNIDIGNTGLAGSATFNNGIWTVNGAGNSVANSTNFMFRRVTGDAAIIARIESNTLSSANTGLMIRGSLASNASFVSVNLNGAGGMSSSASGQGPQMVYSHYQPAAPWWLKVERVGNRVFTYHSQDGVNWTNNALYIMSSLPADVYIGLYTVSNNTSALNSAAFSHVAINNTSPAGSPEISSATAASGTIGNAFTYTITANNGATSFSATGLPAGLTLDATTGIISGAPTITGIIVATLAATNANGTGYTSLVINVADSAVPNAITNLAAVVTNSTNISLTWTGITNASSYSVKRSLSAAGPFTAIQSGVTATSFVDASPVPEVNNYYVVTALAGTQESVNSNVVFASVPPAAPGQPVVISKNKEIDLSWNSASGAATYNVKRATLSGGPYATVANVSTISYTDLNVSNGTPYYYVVSSVGQTKESANSIEAFGVPGSTSVTWSANPQTDSLQLAANWVEHISPVNPAVINFHSSLDTALVNDINGLAVSRMQFNADATSPYIIAGNAIHLRNDLVNNSTATHTLSMPAVLDTLLNVNTVASGGRIALSGVLSGTGSLVKNGIGYLALSGANTYSGNTTLNGNPQSWPPVYGVEMAGTGTGATSAPTSGPLGTGKIMMNGGALITGTNATIYNDIVAVDGTKSYLYQTGGAMNLYGNITGAGTLWQDGNVTAGLHLYGDNSNFTGTFVSALRSGNSRTRFETPQSGSAKAYWLLDANGIDCMGVTFGTGTLNFGALSGRGYIRNDGGGSPLISIGALNLNTSFGGTFASFFNIEKVGTGNLVFTGNHTYGGTTTVKAGRFLLNNDPVAGVFGSPVIVNAGYFGGTGKSTGPATIGTGSGPGAVLEPGNLGVGTLIVSDLTLNSDATYNVELDYGAVKGDKITVNSATLVNHPALAVTGIATGTLPLGTSFTIIDNTGSNAISGTFKNLPELSLVSAGAYNFRITYKGGTGNDVALLDDRTKGVTITSALTDTVLIGKSMNYAITAIKSPNNFTATGLPTGLSVDPATGLITGVPTQSGLFPVTITASNGSTADTAKLALTVQSNIVSNIQVTPGDGQVILAWDPIVKSNFTYHVKRSLTAGGPYTTIANATTSSYLDDNLPNGTTYYYVIASADTTGENPNSAEVSGKPFVSKFSYWPMDEGAGTTAIDIWNNRKGTLNSAVTWATGEFNTGLHSDATANSYTTLPANLVSTLTDFTISAWVKQDVAGVWGRVFDFGTGTTNYMFLTPKGTTGFPRFAITTGSGEQGINGTAAIPTGVWTHMAVTQSGSVAILYINGVEVGRNTAMTLTPSSLGNTTQNYIGKSQWSADPILNGSVDDFRIYSKALTPAEINILKNLHGQTITFNALAQQTVGNADVDPGATTSSGLPITYTSSDTTIAKMVNGKIHAKGAGTVTITAIQAGNGTYAGTEKTQSLVVVGPPPTPVLTAATADGIVPLTWNSSTGATSYNIKRSTVSGGPYTTLKSVTTAAYTDSTVVNGATYFYVVSSMNNLGESANSAQVSVTPAISPNSSYWPFNETTGTTTTDVWNGRIASLNTGATFIAGLSNNALHLDGTANGYATLPAGVVSSLSDFTISTRVKMDAISTWMRLFDFGTSTTNYMFMTVQAALSSGKSTVRYAIKNGGSELNVSFAYTFPLNTWVHLAVTQSGNTASLYINGALVATNTSLTIKPSNLGNTTLNYLGKSQFSADPMFKGTIDDFRIINRALSSSEIAKLQNAANQTITFNALPQKQVGDANFDPSATSTSGLSIKYTSSDTTIVAITSGKVRIKAAGTAVITASQTGGINYYAALPVSQSLTIGKGSQTINFAAIATKHVGDADFDPLASSSAGLQTNYLSSDTTVATIVNGKVHIKAAGTSTITAAQAGNNNYTAATSVSQLLTVVKNSQTISFANIASKYVNDADFDPMATTSSGLAVNYSSSDTTVASIVNGKVHIKAAGSSVITASQTGNAAFAAATSVSQALTINKRGQTITFNAIAQQYVGTADLDSLATSTSRLPVSYSSSDTTVASIINGKIHIKAAGSAVITASQTGNAVFAAASSVSQALTVIKQVQIITFNAIPVQPLGNSDFDPGATTNSGLAVSYSSADTTVATILNGKIHLNGVGTTTITATQAGNETWLPAAFVTQTVTVKDVTPPVVKTKDVTLALDTLGNAILIADQVDNGSSDNVGIKSLTIDKTSFNCANIGPNTVTLTASDASGNTSTGTAIVTVKDVTAPIVPVLADVTGECSATVVAPTTTDNCAGTIVGTTTDSLTYSTQGIHIIHWSFDDGHGNVSAATQKVIVKDDIAPVVAVHNITVQLDSSGIADVTPAQINNGSTDNCGIATYQLSKATFDCSNVGDNTVTLTVTDIHGNVSTGVATVTVQDQVAPTVLTKNISVTLVNGAASITADQIDNGSRDNCGIKSLSVLPATFSCGQYGANTVTLTAVDIHGNSSSATAVVTVNGIAPNPVITISRTDNTYTGLPSNTIALGYGAQNVTLTASNSTSAAAASRYQWSPAAGLSSTTVANPVFTPTAAGTYSFNVIVTNEFGCTATSSVIILVTDVRCGNKVIVCHKTGSSTNPNVELCISANAVDAHLKGGDKLGSCSTITTNEVGTGASVSPANTATANESPVAAKLMAYPNPFGKKTTINFSVPKAEDNIIVEVFNLRGVKVATLYTGKIEAGKTNSIPFDGSALPAGIYVVRLTTNLSGIQTFKMIMAE